MFQWNGLSIAVDRATQSQPFLDAASAHKKKKMLLYAAAAIIAIGIILFLRKR